jgi:hypothetical protein
MPSGPVWTMSGKGSRLDLGIMSVTKARSHIICHRDGMTR